MRVDARGFVLLPPRTSGRSDPMAVLGRAQFFRHMQIDDDHVLPDLADLFKIDKDLVAAGKEPRETPFPAGNDDAAHDPFGIRHHQIAHPAEASAV